MRVIIAFVESVKKVIHTSPQLNFTLQLVLGLRLLLLGMNLMLVSCFRLTIHSS